MILSTVICNCNIFFAGSIHTQNHSELLRPLRQNAGGKAREVAIGPEPLSGNLDMYSLESNNNKE